MKTILLSLVALFASINSFAMPTYLQNFYFDGFGGVNFMSSVMNDDARIDPNVGYALGASLGYKFTSNFRVAGEVAFRKNSVDQIVFSDQRKDDIELNAFGSLQQVTLMANTYINFPKMFNITPYCGAGVGECWTRNESKIAPIHLDEGVLVFQNVISKSNGLAYQGLAGLTFYLGTVQTSIEYHYLDGKNTQSSHTAALNIKSYY